MAPAVTRVSVSDLVCPKFAKLQPKHEDTEVVDLEDDESMAPVVDSAKPPAPVRKSWADMHDDSSSEEARRKDRQQRWNSSGPNSKASAETRRPRPGDKCAEGADELAQAEKMKIRLAR